MSWWRQRNDVRVVPVVSLTIPLQRRLLDALSVVPGMGELAFRHTLLAALREDLGEVHCEESPIARTHMLAMIRACHDAGGFEGIKFLHRAVDLHRPGAAADRLAALVEECETQASILSTDERAELERLLGVLPPPAPAQLQILVQRALGTRVPGTVGAARTVAETFGALEGATWPPGGPHPLVMFALCLADEQLARPARALLTWTERVATRIGCDPTAVREALHGLRAARDEIPADAFLIVKIDDRVFPDGYQLSAWWYRSDGGMSAKVEDAAPCRRDQLDARGEDLLERTSQFLTAGFGELTIEFLVPHQLLGHPFDGWRIAVGQPGQRRIGICYPVVIRSLDRLRDRWSHGDWRRRWQRLSADPCSAASVQWLRPGTGTQPAPDADDIVETAHGEPFLQALRRREQLVCVGLTYPYVHAQEAGLAFAIHAGVPAAVWRRDDGAVAPLRQAVSGFVATGTLAALPERVLGLRQAAVESDVAAVREVSLVWDDPERLPELQASLRGPSVAGDAA
ncbi:hypothetical protein AB0J72_45470 [Dactylosporangium sp. NPDC049742]|uniref:VMAP-C domain-containing protein n=1 Tax=Dactylosporangium sp. NPDC049742 TaxID=3154737 RepID=UPI003446B091